jgi:arylsulfatase A-like enzyme
MEATSLNPALQDAGFEGRAHVFCEQAGDHNLTGCEFITMVRSRDMKLVHYKGESYGQLFDLRADPHEHVNLWDSAAYAPQKTALLDELRDWLIESNYHARDVYADAR